MRVLIIISFIAFQGSLLYAQKEKKDIHEGNQLYQQKKYKEAEASYRKSVVKSQQSVAGNFNLGDALYKQKKLEDAGKKFTDIANTSTDKAVKSQAYHNLGNSLLESNKIEESIAAYKKSLINNPKDDQTRYNLAYAQEKLKQQQQDKKNDKKKDDKDKKDPKDKDKQDQNKDQKDKDKQDKDKQNQDKKDQDKKDEKGEQPQPDKLSKEEAERLLEALNQEEKQTQDKLKNKKAKGVKGRIVKDW
ncbi:MAG: tetratricopeptide repeat protein [Pedobacter sp.]